MSLHAAFGNLVSSPLRPCVRGFFNDGQKAANKWPQLEVAYKALPTFAKVEVQRGDHRKCPWISVGVGQDRARQGWPKLAIWQLQAGPSHFWHGLCEARVWTDYCRLKAECFLLAWQLVSWSSLHVRPRVFIVAYRPHMVRWVAPWTLSSFVCALRAQVCMKAGDYYCLDLPKDRLTPSKAPCLALIWLALSSKSLRRVKLEASQSMCI